MAIGTATAAIASAAIGAGGSLLAANSARGASRDAARATTQANEANIQLARETRAANEALFAQYLGDEQRARAYLDALLYGEGRIGGAPGAAGVGTASLADLQSRYPQQFEAWQDAQSGGEGSALGRIFRSRGFGGGRLNFVQYLQQQGLDVSGAGTPASGGEVITRDQVLAEIAETPLAQFADQDYQERLRLLDESLASETAAIDSEYDANSDLADDARGGLRAESEAQLRQRLANNEGLKRAWEEKAGYERDKAVDLAFSRGGVTGLAGNTTRNVADVGQDYAFRRGLYDAERNDAAYDPHFAQTWDAETGYWDAMTDATGRRGNRRVNLTQRDNAGRTGAYDSYAGDRTGAYADYVGGLREPLARGFSARSIIAGGNDTYASSVSAANNSNANAARDAAYRRAEINNQLYGDLAQIGGDLYGSYANNKAPSVKPATTPKSYYG